MHASNKPQSPDGAGLDLVAGVHAAAVRDLWNGAVGRTVRCVPTRRTVSVASAGTQLYGKWRQGRGRDAAAEWHWLHVLPLLGVRVPAPVAWLRHAGRSLLVTAALPGRSLDAWAVHAAAGGWLDELAGLMHGLARRGRVRARLGPYDVALTLRRLVVRKTGDEIKLTELEAALLETLLKADGQPVGREALLGAVWGYRPGLTTRTLETHIYRLRRKIEHDPARARLLITVRTGYVLRQTRKGARTR
jgi:hypothetical protein